MVDLHLILGGPGAGKTSRLLGLVEEELAAGHRVAFLSFTRQAVNEARERATTGLGIDDRSLTWFRTVHSLCYRALGVTRDEMMTPADWLELGRLGGWKLTGIDPAEGPITTGTSGSRLRYVDDYARATGTDLGTAIRDIGDPVYQPELTRYISTVREFKMDTGKLDFADLLERYARVGRPIPIDVAFIDEAQDLTAAQWAAIERALGGAKRWYVAGDDDQAIYRWSGADVKRFLSLSARPEVLPISHRLPRDIFNLAADVIAGVRHRYEKNWEPAAHEGAVIRERHPEHVDLTGGTWLMLARHRYQLDELAGIAHRVGVLYEVRGRPAAVDWEVRAIRAWETLRRGGQVRGSDARLVRRARRQRGSGGLMDEVAYGADEVLPGEQMAIWHDAGLVGIPAANREYYLACRRNGEKLTGSPRIRIDTIHGVKGAEADQVLLLTDVSGRSLTAQRLDPDAEARVFYVGVTRARRNLHVVMPRTERYYRM